ncbi:MAG: hypothetical protein Q9170_008371, partial [Blastenia crenularia]
MAPAPSQKRKHESITKTKTQRPIKKFKKQTHYSSSSSSASADEASDFPAVDLEDSASESGAEDDDLSENNLNASSSKPDPAPATSTSLSASASDSGASSPSSITPSTTSKPPRQTSKRNDPSAFATSITSILTTKLTTPKRSDPVLAHSSSAREANTALRESALEKRARQAIRAEKKALLEKGRVKDVLLGVAVGDEGQPEEGGTARVVEEERKLKKTAQRGVVKLFNAVRMAQ